MTIKFEGVEYEAVPFFTDMQGSILTPSTIMPFAVIEISL